MFKGFLLFGLVFSAASDFAYSQSILTEEKVIQRLREKSSLLDVTKAEIAGKSLEARLIDERFEARLKAAHTRSKTSEKAPAYQPNLSPFVETNLSLQKKLPVGVALSAGLFGQQSSLQDGSVVDDTLVGARVGFEMDLWKNFFGRQDRAYLNLSKNKVRLAQLEGQTALQKREVQVRKLYWSLVALDKSVELSQELLRSAQEQLRDAERRRSAGVADRGEVAKYSSQADSREASLLFFKYERESLTSELEKILYDFRIKDWQIPADELETRDPIIRKCLADIYQRKSQTENFSDLFEIVKVLKEDLASEISVAKTHGGMDLQLVGQWQTSGRANSYGAAERDLKDEKKSSHTLGLQLTIPLEGRSSRSETDLVTLKEKEYSSRIQSLESELRTTSEKMAGALEILKRGLATQSSNSKNLEINYDEMKKKFRQGRIPFVNLISEQDLLFQSKLQEINTKRLIAHGALDYLAVFNKFPCEWNQY